MFNFKKQKYDISGYKLFKKDLIICTKDNRVFYEDKIIQNDIDGTRIFCKNEAIFFSSYSENKTYSYFDNQIKVIPFVLWFHTIEGNDMIGFDYISTNKSFKIFLYDFQQNIILKRFPNELPLWDLFRNNQSIYFFHNNKTTLSSLSLATGEYLWEVDLGKYSTAEEAVNIREILGIWEDNLVVLMNNNDILVLISLSTGQIVAEIRQILAHCGGAWSFGWYFHLEGGYVYLLQQNSYIRINLSTQSIETLWVHENPRYTIQRVSYDEQYAYFMGSDDTNVQPDTLGVFDRKALQIVWQYEQPIYSSKPPQSDGNKLYCLDSEGTLHIFERENS